MSSASVLLRLAGLTVEFPRDGAHAADGGAPTVVGVDGLDLSVARGEVLGLVGESGSGKSQTALAVLGMSAGNVSGSIEYDGRELTGLSPRAWRALRGAEIAMVFQEPATALDPLFRVGEQVVEVLCAHERVARSAARRRVLELFEAVGLPDPERLYARYPHELSGGMRQRVLIAMATVCGPGLVLADEPTSALDVTTQARILDLLCARVRASGTALILISHDLAVVADRADRVAVMYAGRIVEEAPTRQLFERPLHPYTAALLRSRPELAPARAELGTIAGRPPAPGTRPTGCAFRERCPVARSVCAQVDPALEEHAPRRRVACHVPGEERVT